MIELNDLRKSYKTGDFVQKALDGVSLNLRDNEFVAVLGPSGSGKTTLLNVIGGLDHTESGDIVINGVSTKDYKSADWDTYRNHHIGFVFQSYNLIPHQTVLSNVELALTLSGVPREERIRRAKAELELVGLGQHIHKKPSQLSGGQMQRVAIARALVNDPDIVLADEPTGALDTETGIAVMDLLSEIASDRLVVMVTHNPDLAYEYANRIVTLHDGRVQTDSNPFDPTNPTPAAPMTARAARAAAVAASVRMGAGEPGDVADVADAGTGVADATEAVDAVADASVAAGVSDAAEEAAGAPQDAVQDATAFAGADDVAAPADATAAQHDEAHQAHARTGASKGRKKHASMSFATALSLSFRNLMTKKTRTFLTAFAGSIGIIGIAAILALSNGVNNYIAKVEEDTLSSTPLVITKSSFDITSIMTEASGYMTREEDNPSNDQSQESTPIGGSPDNALIPESQIMSNILSNVQNNDLKSLREFFESGTSGVDELVNAITYNYGIKPLIYSSDTSDGVKQLNPGTLSTITSSGMTSASMMASMSSSFSAFQEMIENQELLEEQYDLVRGKWPEKYDECVLVLNSNGGLSDYTLYSIGVLDPDLLKEMLSSVINSEKIEVYDSTTTFTTDQALSMTYKVVNLCDLYTKNETSNTWTDRSNDKEFVAQQVEKGLDLKVVGIIKPSITAASTSLAEGIGYRHDLILYLMHQAGESAVVQQQIANPEVDVLTGETFEALREATSGGFDMSSMFSVDEVAMANAFKTDTAAIEQSLSNAMSSAASTMDMSSLQQLFSDIPAPDFSNFELDLSGIDQLSPEAQEQIEALVVQAMQSILPPLMQDFMQFAAQQSQEGVTYDLSTEDGLQKLVDDYAKYGNAQQIILDQAEGLGDQLQKLSQDDNGAIVQLEQAFASTMQGVLGSYIQDQFAPYLQEKMSVLLEQYATSLGAAMANAMATAMGQGMSFDANAFANAIHFNMDQDELTSLLMGYAMASDISYEENLSKLGYADETNPKSVSIFAKSFEDKQEVQQIIADYNAAAREVGEPERVISYSDIMGVLMASVTDIVNMISLVLIAFVSISLVVSSIMIGIITYISVLERKKEIGILRAMGASKGNVANIFNAETIIEGLMSGIFAILLVYVASVPVNAIVLEVHKVANVMSLPIPSALGLIAISVFLTFIAGLLPAMKAARRDPVEALRSE